MQGKVQITGYSSIWAYLPDEALRQLALIIFMMEEGSVPAQALLVYVGLIPKATGGERPIGLTAMLYRLALRLRKALVSEWDDKRAGFWDDAPPYEQPSCAPSELKSLPCLV